MLGPSLVRLGGDVAREALHGARQVASTGRQDPLVLLVLDWIGVVALRTQSRKTKDR